MISKNYKVGKIAWNEEHPKIPVILMDGKERASMDLERRSLVKVIKQGSHSIQLVSIAEVHVQFKDLINKEVVSLNTPLAKILECKIDDELMVTKELTETEAKKFRDMVKKEQKDSFIGFMRRGGSSS